MKYKINVPITQEFLNKYMNDFPYLFILKRSERDKGYFYYLDTKKRYIILS